MAHYTSHGIPQRDSSGRLALSGSHNSSTPLLNLTASSGGGSAGTYLRGSRMLDPTMVSGQRIMYAMGRADSSKNMGQVYFGYQGDGSDSNFIALGLHSVDDALQIMGNGCLRTQYQPAFRAYYNGVTSIPSGTDHAPIPTLTTQNVGGYYNTSNGRFTAPVSGTYMFVTCMPQYGSAPVQAYFSSEVWINGSRTSISGWAGGEGGYDVHTATHIIYMNAGDYARLGKEFHQASVVEGSALHPVFSGFFLG